MKNKPIIIMGIVLLIVSAILFIVAGIIAGWDFAGFFLSPVFVWICVLCGLYILIVLFIVIKGKWDRL